MIAETQVGPQTLSVGSRPIIRTDRSAAMCVVDGHARYQEAVLNGNVFSLCLSTTTTGLAAGQIIAGGANAACQFALWNPVSSGVNLVLWQFNLGYVSGTAPAGAWWHYAFNAQSITKITDNTSGTARSMSVPAGPHAFYVCNTGQSAFTFAGQGTPYPLFVTNFAGTGTAQATAFTAQTTDLIDGKIVLPPGIGWIPLAPAAGTSVLVGMSVIWEEIPV